VDDGRYPNLAQVPERPADVPSFAEARAAEQSLIANRNAAGTRPASPDTPPANAASVSPATAPAAKAADTAAQTKVVPRAEDRAPCLGKDRETGQPTTTVRFDQGSATLTAEERGILAEAIPAVRGSSGTIRIVGHGDTETGSGQNANRFDLAVARAGAVAQALAGFGVPTQRMAVSVACADAAASGASVQLYL
jgi:outer membrane protein OmpA-like peptidoglycan-associated protein